MRNIFGETGLLWAFESKSLGIAISLPSALWMPSLVRAPLPFICSYRLESISLI